MLGLSLLHLQRSELHLVQKAWSTMGGGPAPAAASGWSLPFSTWTWPHPQQGWETRIPLLSPFWQLLPVPALGWGRAMMSGVTCWCCCLLVLPTLPPFPSWYVVSICGFCVGPVEPGTRQIAGLIILAKVLLDFGGRNMEDMKERQAELWAGLFAKTV